MTVLSGVSWHKLNNLSSRGSVPWVHSPAGVYFTALGLMGCSS